MTPVTSCGHAGSEDIYAFGSHGLRLVTTPSSGAHPESSTLPAAIGFGGTAFRGGHANFQPERGSEPSMVIFESRKRLADTDTDSDVDVYLRDLISGTTVHISTP
jgi:hypothetical protein